METLAVHGGKAVKTTPFGTGRRFGQRELDCLREALEQNTLFYHHGQMTRRMLARFAEYVGVEYAVGCSSGTAALHVALLAAGIRLGDEVITCANTDVGTVCGVLYQNAVPVFADVYPYSYLLDPAEVEQKITPRTRAIIAVHLTGNPCEMDRFCELERRHNLVLIEDCAQAYGCRYKDKMVGSMAPLGCFSLNEYKHINCGDGGVVVTNDRGLYEAAYNFADKCYNRLGGMERRVWQLAPNYRITELQSAVALAQLEKVEPITARRHELGDRFNAGIAGLAGVHPHAITPGGYATYWFTGFTVEADAAGVSPQQFADALRAEGIGSARLGYFSLLEHDLFRKRNAYGGSHFPFEGGPP
jgi:dTDP-4-amino-4,6-dideoxygalactose transaminase